MTITQGNVVVYITVLIFTFSVIKYVVVDPLTSAINELRKSIEQILVKLELISERLVKVESSVQSAHHRIDTMENKK